MGHDNSECTSGQKGSVDQTLLSVYIIAWTCLKYREISLHMYNRAASNEKVPSNMRKMRDSDHHVQATYHLISVSIVRMCPKTCFYPAHLQFRVVIVVFTC